MEILKTYILIVSIIVLWNVYVKKSIKNLFDSFLKSQMNTYLKKCSCIEEKKKIKETYRVTAQSLHSFSLRELVYLLKISSEDIQCNKDSKVDGIPNESFCSKTVEEYQNLAHRTLFACLNLCTVKGLLFSVLLIIKGIIELFWNSRKSGESISATRMFAQPILIICFICSVSLTTRNFEQPQRMLNNLTSSASCGYALLRPEKN